MSEPLARTFRSPSHIARRLTAAAALGLLALPACGGDGPTEQAGPDRIELVAGSGQSAVIASSLADAILVRVSTAAGRPVTGALVRFSVPAGAGAVSPSTVATNAAGEAATNWTLGGVAGAQTLTVSTTGAAAVTVTATATAGTASRLELRPGATLSGVVNAPLPTPVVVRLVDAGGNPVAGKSISFGVDVGAVAPTIVTTNAAGEASVTWTLGTTAGSQRLLVMPWLDLMGVVPPLHIDAVATAGPAAKFSFVTESQAAPVGAAIAAPVLVTDLHDNPVAGATVTFGVALGDGTVSATQAATDATGRAATTWTLGATVGTQRLRASVAGLSGESLTTATVTTPLRVLAHRVVDAEFSPATGRIVTISAAPAQLHVIDAATGDVRSVALPKVPVAVSVRPDGQYAAVAHDALVSYVDLAAVALERTYATTTDAEDVVLASNGYAYVFPRTDQWVSLHSLNLATGLETASNTIRERTLAKLHPSGEFMYGANNGLSPSDVEKYDISAGVARVLYDSPYHGDYAFDGDLWISDDGARLFTRSGNVFRSSPVQAEDLRYAGKLEGVAAVRSLADSRETGRIVLLAGDRWDAPAVPGLRVYEAEFLGYRGTLGLPSFPIVSDGTTSYVASTGRFVFMDAAGATVYVLVQAPESAGVAQDWGLGSYPASVLP